MQGAANGGQAGGVIYQSIFADQVTVDGHDAVGVFQCAFRHAFTIGVREDGYGRGAFLNQHIQMLAQTVRPAPCFAVQVPVGHDQARLAGFHEVEQFLDRGKLSAVHGFPFAGDGPEKCSDAPGILLSGVRLQIRHHKGVFQRGRLMLKRRLGGGVEDAGELVHRTHGMN